MVKSCCAVGCANRYSKDAGIPFYHFPTNPEKKALWVAAVNRKDWARSEYSWICGAHFISGCKSDDPVSPDYVPSVFNYTKSPRKRKLVKDMERYVRMAGTKKRRADNDNRMSAAQSLLDLSENGNGYQFCEPHTGTYTSTTMTMNDIDILQCSLKKSQGENSKLLKECESLKQDNDKLVKENARLEKHCKQLQEERSQLRELTSQSESKVAQLSLSQESFMENDAKVKYYTGLPNFATLMALFNFLSPCIEIGNRSVLSLFQQLIIVLLKLCLNVGDQDIAYRFCVNQSTISRCFNKWIDAMYVRLKPLIKWPGRDELMKTMPMDFRKCVTIIDCLCSEMLEDSVIDKVVVVPCVIVVIQLYHLIKDLNKNAIYIYK